MLVGGLFISTILAVLFLPLVNKILRWTGVILAIISCVLLIIVFCIPSWNWQVITVLIVYITLYWSLLSDYHEYIFVIGLWLAFLAYLIIDFLQFYNSFKF